MSTSISYNSIEQKAITLLGAGLAPGIVAASCGVSESRISQLLSQQDFADRVIALKLQALEKVKGLDDKYDRIEEALVDKLEKNLHYMYKPEQVLRAVQVINAAKRKAPTVMSQDTLAARDAVVELTIPTTVIKQFTTNINQQVISVGGQTLVTLPSNQLENLFSGDSNDTNST